MEHEALIRLFSYGAVFLTMAVLETLFPRRPRRVVRSLRWTGNIAVTVLNTLLVRTLLPMTAMGAASVAAARGWGIFNLVSLPGPLAGLVCIVLFDLVIYAQHVLFHLARPLWRLHMMHHADLDIDVTTGARFHPVEILLSMLIKMGAVVILGAPAWSVMAFEVILNGMAMFNHSNVALPAAVDAPLRAVVVTPDMHRVHHSVIIGETNSNYGFNLSLWDRFFGTYRPQPVKGHLGMTIGLANFRDPGHLRLDRMLLMPLDGRVR